MRSVSVFLSITGIYANPAPVPEGVPRPEELPWDYCPSTNWGLEAIIQGNQANLRWEWFHEMFESCRQECGSLPDIDLSADLSKPAFFFWRVPANRVGYLYNIVGAIERTGQKKLMTGNDGENARVLGQPTDQDCACIHCLKEIPEKPKGVSYHRLDELRKAEWLVCRTDKCKQWHLKPEV